MDLVVDPLLLHRRDRKGCLQGSILLVVVHPGVAVVVPEVCPMGVRVLCKEASQNNRWLVGLHALRREVVFRVRHCLGFLMLVPLVWGRHSHRHTAAVGSRVRL